MKTSILIAAHNEGDLLWRTVRSCLDTLGELEAEIILVDDASTDNSVQAVHDLFPKIEIISHPRRRGVAYSKDHAAKAARGDIFLFLDGHCKPEPGAIARLVSGVEETGGQGILTPKVPALDTEKWENKPNQAGHGYWVDLAEFACGWMGLADLEVWSGRATQTLYDSPGFIGCCGAVSRDLYEKLWGFDRMMGFWGVEDIDFGLKARLLGHPILHDPEAAIGHRFRKSFDNYPVPMEHVIANQLRMARKNFSDRVWRAWLENCKKRQPEWLWTLAWETFEAGRESVEAERKYLFDHRVYDEFWYAETFGYPWPAREEFARLAVTPQKMEAFAAGLRTAKETEALPPKAFRALHSRFRAEDQAGGLWTVGVQTGAWHTLEDGQWRPRPAPDHLLIPETVHIALARLSLDQEQEPAILKCAHCGASVGHEDRFCGGCGVPAPGVSS